MDCDSWLSTILEGEITEEESRKRLRKMSIPSYLLTLDEFLSIYNKKCYLFGISRAYDKYQKKIADLVALIFVIRRLSKMKFNEEEMDAFKSLTRMSYAVMYENGVRNEKESKKYFKQRLREHGRLGIAEYVIVRLVSAVEVYFKTAFEEIFNDDDFINCYLNDKNPHHPHMRRFFTSTKILNDFQKEFFLHGKNVKGMSFGSTIVNKKDKGISFQRKENIKSFLDIFFKVQDEKDDFLNIMIEKLNYNEEKDNKELRKYWDAFGDIVKARNSIIHSNAVDKEIQKELENKLGFSIFEVHNKNFETNIYNLLQSYADIISLIDSRLFTYFEREYDESYTCIEPLTIDMN